MPSRRRSTIIQLGGANALLIVGIIQGLLLVPLYVSMLGIDLYGYWLSLSGIVSLLALADLGVTNLVTQRGAKLAGGGDFKGFSELSGSLAFWNGAASVLILVGGAAATVALPSIFNVPENMRGALRVALFLSTLEILFLTWSCTIGVLLFALQRPTVHMLSLIFSSILGIIVTVVLLYLGWGLIALPIGGCLRALLPLPFNLRALQLELGSRGVTSFGSPSRDTLKNLFSDALLLAPSQWLETMLTQIDSVVALHFLGPSAVAVLEITKKAAAVGAPFIGRVSASFLPALAHLHGAQDAPRLKSVMEKLQSATLYAAVIYFGMICLMNEAFVKLWIGPELFGGQSLTILIACVSVIRIFKGLFYNLSRARDEVRFTALSSYVEFPVHIVLALSFVGIWGLQGILWGALLAGFAGLALQAKGLTRTSISIFAFLHAHVLTCVGVLSLMSIVASSTLSQKIGTWSELLVTLSSFGCLGVIVVLACDRGLRADIRTMSFRARG